MIFHTNTESGKTDDLDSDPNVNIAFLNGTGEWASISGHATVVTDREAVRAHYSPSLKAWLGDLGDGTHDGGPEDPRIGVIRVKARTATYAIAVGTVMGRGAEIIKGAVTGQAPKVSKLRELNEEDLDECMSYLSKFIGRQSSASQITAGRAKPMLTLSTAVNPYGLYCSISCTC